jgi:hypothetical protein
MIWQTLTSQPKIFFKSGLPYPSMRGKLIPQLLLELGTLARDVEGQDYVWPRLDQIGHIYVTQKIFKKKMTFLSKKQENFKFFDLPLGRSTFVRPSQARRYFSRPKCYQAMSSSICQAGSRTGLAHTHLNLPLKSISMS